MVDHLLADQDPHRFLETQDVYFAKLRDMFEAGLSPDHVLVLAKTWSRGACVHIQQALPRWSKWGRRVDDGVISLVEHVTGDRLDEAQRMLVFVKMGEGGLGFGSAILRQSAAWIGVWEGGVGIAVQALGFEPLPELEQAWPAWCVAIARAHPALGGMSGCKLDPCGWATMFDKPPKKRQREHTTEVHR